MRRALNAQHDWYIGGAVKATLNPPPSVAGYPRLELSHAKGITGWFAPPEADEAVFDTPAGRAGEQIYPRATRGKTLVYNLQYKGSKAGGYAGMSSGLLAFTAAFADKSSLGLLVVTPWEGIGPGATTVEVWGTFARCMDFDADDVQAYGEGRIPSPWIRDPLLTIRQLDGIWFWLNESGTLFTPMSWTGTTSVSVVNTGNAPAPPTITVTGVALGTDLHVGRDAVGAYPAQDLWFRDPVAAAGLTGSHDVAVDFPNRKCWIGTTDITKCYDASQSDWWDEFVPGIPPGTFNVWRGPGAGTGINVHIYSCSW